MIECVQREGKMRTKNKILGAFAVVGTILCAAGFDAMAQAGARSSMAGSSTTSRTQGRQVDRGDNRSSSKSGVVASRTAQRTVSNSSRAASSAAVARSVAPVVRAQERKNVTAARSGVSMSAARSAVPVVRTNAKVVGGGARRVARAAAVFDDVSKIGGGYSSCRDSYATCMDQFCAKANETYRRCFCSERFVEFRDIEDALDQSKILLQQFEDNSLNAVDKSAAEVDAMYSATVGEAAIKNDTSAAQKTLDAIGDLLSGKNKSTKVEKASSSYELSSLDLSFDMGDVWSGGDLFSSSSSSIFGGGSGLDMGSLEGDALFKAAHKQCAVLAAESCSSDAVANLVKSSYGIMITQDCNLYQKSIDAKREAVMGTVRQAEKYLREARLENYRAHNSSDVNECLDRVRSAMFADTACGSNYRRCLDYSGAYINQATGEPIYSQRLFEMTDLITLAGVDSNMDVLGQNPKFDSFLDSKRQFADTALDTCRGIADSVWSEFKRVALIEIAQAQDEKIESVKATCVDTMKQCYDTQSGALKSFDDTTAQASGALSAYAAREMCQDKVAACASLYGDTDGCKFDGNGKLTADSKKRCGLEALLKFVDTVDTVRIGEGCYTGIDNYLKQQCATTDENYQYPWGCKTVKAGSLDEVSVVDSKFFLDDEYGKDAKNRNTLAGMIVNYVNEFCPVTDESMANLSDRTLREMRRAFDEARYAMGEMLKPICEQVGGMWSFAGEELEDLKKKIGKGNDSVLLNDEFHRIVFAGDKSMGVTEYGVCLKNDVQLQCDIQNLDTDDQGFATYDSFTNTCNFAEGWYRAKCAKISGTWRDNACFIEGIHE